MARKPKKPKTTEIDNDTRLAATILLQRAWTIAAVHNVCPLCMVFEAAFMVEEAEKDGLIEHGIAELDENHVNLDHMGTLQ